ncbi:MULTISPECIES: MFS transporter [unclassified Paenibacillus]|uniref:MFS transporter n=1 Tax=unclassified Paenibacillus TaxID=185978 RepID=UPI001AE84143|nr:MFS family permease [Paenibacillus sp. PvP091]MBP1168759.1 MFS family permease [Paenibacillus sp. PvR098]MBP2439787.1 MFS family permease [Paenibacillus sp. PvP052]
MVLFSFLVIHLLNCIALVGTRPIVSLYAHDQGASAVIIGLLVSTYAFIPMLVSITVGKWVDDFGARKITILGGAVMAIGIALPASYPGLITLFISQLVLGFSMLCALLSLQKTIGNLSGSRDKLMAHFSVMASIGELLGPLISGKTYENFGFQATYTISFVVVFLGLLVAIMINKNHWSPETKTTSGGNQRNLLSTVRLLENGNLRKAVVISGLVMYSKDLFVAYFPVYASGIGMKAGSIGIILSIMAGASMSVRLVQFYLVERFGRGRVLTATLSMSAIAFLLIPQFTQPALLTMLAFLLGMGLGLGQPLSMVYALNHSPIHRQGEVLGLRMTVNRGSQFFAPFLFGTIGGIAGLASIFWLSGALVLIGAYYTRMKESENAEQKAVMK